MTREEYKAIVKPFFSEKRMHHSVCVAEEAESLAKKYGADPEKAWIGGILHDIMKEMPADEQLKRMNEFGIILSDLEQGAQKLWHAILGAEYVRQELKIDDPDIVDPIYYHTTARADMTLLEKILFMADYVSADRKFDGVKELRKTAYQDLDKAVLLGCGFSIQDLSARYLSIHPNTLAAYNWYVMHQKDSK